MKVMRIAINDSDNASEYHTSPFLVQVINARVCVGSAGGHSRIGNAGGGIGKVYPKNIGSCLSKIQEKMSSCLPTFD